MTVIVLKRMHHAFSETRPAHDELDAGRGRIRMKPKFQF
jgi:hypothetical protein